MLLLIIGAWGAPNLMWTVVSARLPCQPRWNQFSFMSPVFYVLSFPTPPDPGNRLLLIFHSSLFRHSQPKCLQSIVRIRWSHVAYRIAIGGSSGSGRTRATAFSTSPTMTIPTTSIFLTRWEMLFFFFFFSVHNEIITIATSENK